MAEGAIAHHLIFPSATIFCELIFKYLWFTTIHADGDGVGLALIEGPERNGVDSHFDGIASNCWEVIGCLAQLHHLPIVAQALHEAGIVALTLESGKV